MRETFFLSRTKKKTDTVEAANLLVQKQYPGSIRHGSTCHWTWMIGDKIVAEAWARDRDGWYLTIRP